MEKLFQWVARVDSRINVTEGGNEAGQRIHAGRAFFVEGHGAVDGRGGAGRIIRLVRGHTGLSENLAGANKSEWRHRKINQQPFYHISFFCENDFVVPKSMPDTFG